MRKKYCKPEVRAESIEVGVFGDYGGKCDQGLGTWGSFVGIFNPLFGLCCGSGD